MNDSPKQERWCCGGEAGIERLRLGSEAGLRSLTRGVEGTWTASGRGALYLLLERLRAQGIDHVQLPAFLCESILSAVRATGIGYTFYSIDEALQPDCEPRRNAAVLAIDYFGWTDAASLVLQAGMPEGAVLIEDATQALLSDWSPASPVRRVMFSVRKFAPTVLGGWCSEELVAEAPPADLEAAAWRCVAARALRGAYLASADEPVEEVVERHYLEAFGELETVLDARCGGYALPRFFAGLVAGTDWKDVVEKRRHNWLTLHEALAGCVQPLFASLPRTVVPVGYVIRVRDRDRVRAALAGGRVFCASHWPLPSEVDPSRFPAAAELSRSCLTIPIDQRYGSSDMERVAAALRGVL